MKERMIKLPSKKYSDVALHVIPGHFATSHSHVNYYIDITSLKTRMHEAESVAKVIASAYGYNSTVVDTIVCMDRAEVIGACLAKEFEKRGFVNKNLHNTIYVITPEFNANKQIIFRDNNVDAIKNKNIILLLANTTTGKTIKKSVECVEFYGGHVQGVSSVFSSLDEIDGIKINSVFTPDDIPSYQAFSVDNCPFCKNGQAVEAIVNGYGYSLIGNPNRDKF